MGKSMSLFKILMICIFLQHQDAASLSPKMQKLALFRFKLSLEVNQSPSEYCSSSSYPKTMNWSMSSDCCTWDGVSCDHNTGDIIGLDLSCSQLAGAILPNSTLFHLSHLQSLNLAYNELLHSHHFYKNVGFFAPGLTHLNLSHTDFSEENASGISNLYKLVSLDLSDSGLKLEHQLLELLLQNFTYLRILHLQGLDISSVLPMNLSTSLTHLYLGGAGLHGVLPDQVFHLPNLEVLDLNYNKNLRGNLPKLKWGSSSTLRMLDLGDTGLSGEIPDSISYLKSLTSLSLSHSSFSGPITASIRNLTLLTELFLSKNSFSGQIPNALANLTYLTHIDLNSNSLSGAFPSSVLNLKQLHSLDLSLNSLTGPLPANLTAFCLSELYNLRLGKNSLNKTIPSWLFDLPSLTELFLDSNRFTGKLTEFTSVRSKLERIDFGNNLLYGTIPQSFSHLVNLTYLDLSSNNFIGVLDIEMLSRLSRLEYLYFSHNSISLRNYSATTAPPYLAYLDLSYCNIKEFPHFLRATRNIVYLDLSNNQIDGEIPPWIGDMGRDSLRYLNLSYNSLTGGFGHLPWNYITYLDLHSNMLNGSLPASICKARSLSVLNLCLNNLSGALPNCTENLTSLLVFDIRMNNIRGRLPSTLSNFHNLRSLYLTGNNLEGTIPPSFAEFEYLEVLDLGNNQINDTFPHHLEALPNLQILVLKSNHFHGSINNNSKIRHPFPSLRIIDLSYNDFSGPLPARYIKNFKAMMNSDVSKMKSDYMVHDYYYSDSSTLVIKGVETKFYRILTILTVIDLSRNRFHGEIPEYIGDLVSLIYLNLSHNHLIGQLPSSIPKLSMLESLDFSFNRLEGEIPQELASMTSLSRLNLSQNQLRGRIPQGNQFNTFENDSYIGNLALCGYPLSIACERDNTDPGQNVEEGEDDDLFFNGFTWKAVVIGYGSGVVLGFSIGYLMFMIGKPKWLVSIITIEPGLKVTWLEIRTRWN